MPASNMRYLLSWNSLGDTDPYSNSNSYSNGDPNTNTYAKPDTNSVWNTAS
jgi:hypothetical protein